MKAVVQDRYGEADVLALRDIEDPAPGDGEVLIRVRAAGVDPGAWHLMTGRPYLVRVMGFGFRAPKVKVRGRDVAGTVQAVTRASRSSSPAMTSTARSRVPSPSSRVRMRRGSRRSLAT